MRRACIFLAVFTGLVAAPAMAQRIPEVESAIKRRYPGAETEILGRKTINDVRVFDVKVTTRDGESRAQITEGGDFVLYGQPKKLDQLNPMAAQTLQGLFGSVPSNIDMYRTTQYAVDIEAQGGKQFRIHFDAVGRVRNVDNGNEIDRDSLSSLKRANDAGAREAEKFAIGWLPNTTSGGVYHSENAQGFYVVACKYENGTTVLFECNHRGVVYGYRQELEKGNIPAPVQQALEPFVAKARVKQVYRMEFEYFEFQQPLGKREPYTVRVRPNGDILSIAPVVAETAAEKQ
ncbi:MAG: hypothetical protein H7144_12610 [Burkholderiales bacterium]|nr:hypothetical protein [Phycisphaerae bacterium]